MKAEVEPLPLVPAMCIGRNFWKSDGYEEVRNTKYKRREWEYLLDKSKIRKQPFALMTTEYIKGGSRTPDTQFSSRNLPSPE